MFHVYFGAFDIVLYLIGTYFATVLAQAICDELERSETTQTTTLSSSTQTAHQLPSVPQATKAKDVVTVSVRG